MTQPTLRCLWLARALPFPPDSGDRIYTARLAGALAEAGARVHFLGHAAEAEAMPPGPQAVTWHGVEGGRLPVWRGLASRQPLNGAVHATPAYRQRLDRLLAQEWDMVVIDHHGMAWALPEVQRRIRHRTRPPVLVHVAHEHETTLWQGMASLFRGSPLRRLALWLNQRKVRRVEAELARSVDLLCCTAAEDAAAFEKDRAGGRTLVLTPGYSGLQMPDRTLDAAVPRRALMVGSFRWVAQQQNLKALLRQADVPFMLQGIGLDVVGDMPDALRAQLAGYGSVRLHGHVDDIAPLYRQARLALVLVPELVGGGFMLKFLGPVFGRIPVVTLDAAAAGLPPAVRGAMVGCSDLQALVDAVIARIDALPTLDELQRRAHAAAAPLFHWPDRGVALRDAVKDLAPEVQRAATRPLRGVWA